MRQYYYHFRRKLHLRKCFDSYCCCIKQKQLKAWVRGNFFWRKDIRSFLLDLSLSIGHVTGRQDFFTFKTTIKTHPANLQRPNVLPCLEEFFEKLVSEKATNKNPSWNNNSRSTFKKIDSLPNKLSPLSSKRNPTQRLTNEWCQNLEYM